MCIRDSRTTTYSIEGTDSIAGHQYFQVKGAEAWGENGDVNVFMLGWIRRDSAGNVVGLDSTMTLPTFFPNEFLTQGYSRTYGGACGDQAGLKTCQDSVMSVTETVSVPAGTFANCLKISETHYDSSGTAIWHEYHYYAYGIGLVKDERTLPGNEAHTDVLTEYIAGAAAGPVGPDEVSGKR